MKDQHRPQHQSCFRIKQFNPISEINKSYFLHKVASNQLSCELLSNIRHLHKKQMIGPSSSHYRSKNKETLDVNKTFGRISHIKMHIMKWLNQVKNPSLHFDFRNASTATTCSIHSLLHIWDWHYLFGLYHRLLWCLHRHANLRGMAR